MCNCECGLRVYSKKAVAMFCPQCKREIHCGQGATALPEQDLPTPQPRHKWPSWATAIARFAKPQDSGVGDTAQRCAAIMGGEVIKGLLKRCGVSCGCNERQYLWNQLYPYCVKCGKPANRLCEFVRPRGPCNAPLCKSCEHRHPKPSGIADHG